jgi:hypothetical protein
MQRPKQVFRGSQSYEWTRERVERLRKPEIEQLRDNAGKLGANDVVVLCEEALRTLPKGGARGAKGTRQPKRPRRLISRLRAFEARGVFLQDGRLSWGGVRKSDGAVVLGIWADAIESGDGACSYLLWAPNAGGARPWSDKAGGQERLEHCKLALSAGVVEALLVYGERLEGYIPEDRTRSVHGVDPETVVTLKVERRGEEYWAVWGRKRA